MKQLFYLIGLGVFLTGCTVIPPKFRFSEATEDLPARWAASPEAQAGIDHNWVRRIGGSRAESLVKKALAANPDIQVAAERVNRALASASIAGAALNPQVSARLGVNRQEQRFVGIPVPAASSLSTSYNPNLTVSWEPDIWGVNRRRKAARIADAQVEGNLYRASRASLAAQVMRAWLALAEANEQIALATETDALLKATLEIVRDRYLSALTEDGGSASQVRLAESEIAQNNAMLEQRRGDREIAIRQLEVLMGGYPAGSLKSADRLPAMPSRPPAGLPSELLLRRPDILAAERRFASTGNLLKVAKRALYPSFTITAQGGTTTSSLRDIFNSDFGVWSLAGALAQPIWAGGSIRAEIDRMKSEDRGRLAELQSTVLKAFGEVEQAFVTDIALKRRQAAMSKAVKTAIEASDAAASEYTAGTTDALTLITARSNQINLESQVITLRRLRLDNRVTLHLALGGDYRPQP